MSEHAGPPPEGALITAALKRRKLSARAAAPQAGISETRWRQITSGYQTVSGQRIPVRAPDDTIARMAQVAGVTPEELINAGRVEAADELRSLPPMAEQSGEVDVADAVLDRIERDPRLQRRLRRILAAGSGQAETSTEHGTPDTKGDAGRDVAG